MNTAKKIRFIDSLLNKKEYTGIRIHLKEEVMFKKYQELFKTEITELNVCKVENTKSIQIARNNSSA